MEVDELMMEEERKRLACKKETGNKLHGISVGRSLQVVLQISHLFFVPTHQPQLKLPSSSCSASKYKATNYYYCQINYS